MINKFWKKITASLLTVAMMLSMMIIVPVQAVEGALSFNDNAKYAMISKTTGKAFTVTGVGYSIPTEVSGQYDEKNQTVKDSSVVYILQQSTSGNDTVVKLKLGDGETYLRTENADGFYYPWADIRSDLCTYIITKTGDNEGIIKDQNYDKYIKVGENEKLTYTKDKSEAEVFTFVEDVKVLDTTVSIQNVDTKKYLTFENQENLKPIKLVDKDTLSDNEKFIPQFTVNDNYTMTDVTGKINTVFFQSKGNSKMGIISATWQDGAVSAIVSKETSAGGWESISILPKGNGVYALRSSYTYQYITVNENDELALCDKTEEELTDRELFKINSSIAPDEVTDLSVNSSSRTETTLDLSWTNPVCLYTDIQLMQKGKDDIEFKKIANLTTESSYQVTGLKSGNKYQFKLVYINGNEKVSTESNVLEAKTRAGVKPATPNDVTIKETDENKVKISWNTEDKKDCENATHYQIVRADSRFGTYETVKTVKKGTLSTEVEITNDNKYCNYYKVVALNNGESDEIDDDAEFSDLSEFVSLETNLFGDHTLIFAETDDVSKIDETLKQLFDQQNDYNADAQFKAGQYQVYFKPGDYTQTSCINLGFYTSINGLGKTPYDVKLNNIAIPAYLPAGALGGNGDNATCNFWRSAENLSIINTGNEQGKAQYGSYRPDQFNWAVAQAAPLRRVYSTRPVAYDWNYGWASGGYVADCKFEGTFNDNGQLLSAGTFSGQQFYTRNSELTGNAYGTTLNNFFQGVKAPNLPNGTTGEKLVGGNGYSNWNIPSSDNGQQVFTNVEKTKELSEKPFLYIDDEGEYQVFVPSLRKNTSGVSWSKDSMGEGESVSLSEFYVAKPTDSASKINEQIAAGKNIYFTPGTYHAEEPILVNKDNTLLLGTGMASIIPDNGEAAMIIADDVENVKVAGLIFDAGAHSKYLLKVGENVTHEDHSGKPVVLQDLFFRVGGTTDSLTTADDALVINSDDVITDHFWIWRADHGAGVAWDGNESKHGMIVNGDDVTCYALFNEHFQGYDTLWNGENGATYFYQNEKCYDPFDQESWMTHNGTVNGYAAYKVANNVKKHYAVGLGIYNVFIYTGGQSGQLGDGKNVSIQMDNAIEVPNSEDVIIENACIQTFANEDGALQKFNHIINGVGDSVSSGKDSATGEVGEGWARKFLISYQNGTAVVGKTTDKSDAQKGKYIGVDKLTGVKQLGEEIDSEKLQSLKDLMTANESLIEENYTAASWKAYKKALEAAQNAVSEDYLKYMATQKDFDDVVENYNEAIKGLESVVNKDTLQETYDNYADLKADDYTPESWAAFNTAFMKAKKLLENSNATQEEIDAMNQELTDAKNALVKNSSNTGNGGSTNTGTNDNNSSQGNSQTNTTSKTHSTRKNVKTGDDSAIALFVSLALLSTGLYFIIRRKHEN